MPKTFSTPEEKAAYQSIINKRHYETHKHLPEFRARLKKNREAQYIRNQEWLKEYKKTCHCSKCLVADFRVLDFHHIEREGKIEVSNLVRKKCSIARIEREIAKCIVLCANCHRILHHEENNEAGA